MTRPFACRIDKYQSCFAHLKRALRFEQSSSSSRLAELHSNPFANCAQAFFNSHFLRSCKICDGEPHKRMCFKKSLTHVCGWVHMTTVSLNDCGTERWDTRWGIGDNSLKLPHCVPNPAYLHTYIYILPELILNDPNLLFSLHLLAQPTTWLGNLWFLFWGLHNGKCKWHTHWGDRISGKDSENSKWVLKCLMLNARPIAKIALSKIPNIL